MGDETEGQGWLEKGVGEEEKSGWKEGEGGRRDKTKN